MNAKHPIIDRPQYASHIRRTIPMLIMASVFVCGLLLALDSPTLVRASTTTIAPPVAADFTATGENPASQFGFDVAPAGDINGDGYADVVVGANSANKAYVYTGTVNGLTKPAFFTISKSDGQFGYSVAGDGDFDLNGADDILISAPIADVSTEILEAGLVYVYTGTVGGLPTAAVTLTGEFAGGRFGWSVDVAGDVNNDGYADVIVGAPQYGLSGTGRVYIYHGGPSGVTNTVNLSITGEALLDGFGVSVSRAGDVNGDSYDDIVVGAWQNDDGGTDAGKAYVYYGSVDGIVLDDADTIIGTAGEGLGTSVSEAGDVNGDGYADVIIGSDAYDVISPTAGLMRVYLGSPDGLSPTPNLIELGETDNDRYGFVVSGGGDLNGDGFDDVMVGAYEYDTDILIDTGKAYIYAGCFGGVQSAPVFTATGEYDIDNYGRSVAAVGDVNQDGLDDMLVGAFGGKTLVGEAPLPTGKVYGYHGAEVGTCEPQIVLTKTVSLANYGPLCEDNKSITVPVTTPVNYCYLVENTGNITLTHHFIDDAGLDGLQMRVPYTLAPGMTYTHVVTHTPTVSATTGVTWTGIISITAPGGAPTLPEGRILSATATATATVGLSPSSLDQDGDGVPDVEEGTGDADNDGIPAYLDPDEQPEPGSPRIFLPHIDQ